MKIFVSAGESSGDLYAAALVAELQKRLPSATFLGCAGPRLQALGVRPIVDSRALNVVGLVEVVRHIPRIRGVFHQLAAAAQAERPDLAILTDSSAFHLRLAPKLHALGIPIVYLVAPQAWAWREGRVKTMRRYLSHLLCIFPFEEDFFASRGVRTTYIGHPLTRLVKPEQTRDQFLASNRIPPDRPVVTLLPGSRPGEIARHLPILAAAVERIGAKTPATFLLATPKGLDLTTLKEPGLPASIQHIGGATWDAIAHADLALAASGTVTIEAAMLGTPMVAYYKVSPWSWWMGRYLVKVPFFSMVNLVAGRAVVPELIQDRLSPDTLAEAALRLLGNEEARLAQKLGLHEVTRKLASDRDPMERAADIVLQYLPGTPAELRSA
ncbi:MAG: lipid-A-disaccharide synthase [Bryobacteraceae bacterium]